MSLSAAFKEGTIAADGSEVIPIWASRKETAMLQNKDRMMGDRTSHSKVGPDGNPGAFVFTDLATVAQTFIMVANFYREYQARKAAEEDAAETITRASEDLNLSRKELADKYNLGNVEAARYKEMITAGEGITGAMGAEAGGIVEGMGDGSALAAREGDYDSYMSQGITDALSGATTADAGGGDQFAAAISDAMGVERAAATDETGAMAELLAAGGEDVRLAEEMAKADASVVEGGALGSALEEVGKVDKVAMRDRRSEAERERGLAKSDIEGKYKMLAPRVIGPKFPDLPDSWAPKKVEIVSRGGMAHTPGTDPGRGTGRGTR